MRNLQSLVGTGLGAIATFVALAIPLRAQPTILDVIELGPILARHDVGNALGLAFDPQLNVFYLTHGSDTRGAFIYTLDAQGRLLDEYDFQSAYAPGSFLESLSYDEASGHLFALAEVPVGTDFVAHLLELEPGAFTVLTDQVIDNAGGGGIHVRTDGIWQARFAEDVIRHYSRALALIDDVSVAASFPGFPGPSALTSSFRGGFFLVDHFDRRLVEVDTAGHQIAEASTAMLRGFGRALAIDIDRATRRIFLQVENSAIYVLSDEFIRPGPTVVAIDVKPGSVPNSINPRSRGVIPVAILTTAAFDAAMVSPSSVRFGPHGAIAARGHMEDAEGDGDLDWLFHFRTEETGIQCSDHLVFLTAETLGGLAIQGTDPIVTVGCK